ncbi:serine/threonine-protein kinase ppk5-like [Phoenix dactylifera]|uniref:Serine/threonine-protein kinase ppk5-like n=1 Tax=Phoenix dactylifera TaxID=42345 RepID=A0A8B7CFV9_PHODC|nr:serine/threonine-protein kinase ppk5-like [Phoenix dactylifera]
MADSVDVVLEFLRKNQFTKAEAALLGELNCRPDLNGSLQRHLSDEREKVREDIGFGGATNSRQQGAGTWSREMSKEFIVKEIEVGGSGNGSESKKGFGSKQGQESGWTDLCPWNFGPVNSAVNSNLTETGAIASNFAELSISKEPMHRCCLSALERRDSAVETDSDPSAEQKISSISSKSKTEIEVKPDVNQISGSMADNAYAKAHLLESLWLKSEEPSKGCSMTAVFPLPVDNASSSYDGASGLGDGRKEPNKKGETNDNREVTKEQLDDVGRPCFSGKSPESIEQRNTTSFDLPHICENNREELPRLPPVRLKSEDKLVNLHWEEKVDRQASGMKLSGHDNIFMIGSFLDVPIGQDINSSGGKRTIGSSWLSVSQGIAEDTSDLVSGFATVGDDSIDYPNEYWDSDEYDDDDDVGYMRQPIEDETWFLAHEIDYPSDNEKGTGHGSVPDHEERVPRKDEDDEHSFAEEDLYLSGEQYFHSKNIKQVAGSEGLMELRMSEKYRADENDLMAQYDEQLMDIEELNLMRAEPVWRGFVTQGNKLVRLGNEKILHECEQGQPVDPFAENDQHGSVRSIGVGVNSDAADIGSEVRESLVGGSSEGDIEYFHDHDIRISSGRHSQHDTNQSRLNSSKKDKIRGTEQDPDNFILASENGSCPPDMSYIDGGFSFPPPARTGDMLKADSGKSLWSSRGNAIVGDDANECANGMVTEDICATWRRKSSDSSPVRSLRDEKTSDAVRSSRNSTASSTSNYAYAEREDLEKGREYKANDAREEDPGTTLEDEEAAALQEQVRQIQAQEEEFETFNLKIVHRKNRTGFEEDKNFHVVLNSVIAGRYHVTEFLGSAAFSKAIQAHDLHTGMDVCMKIIKNNKDFFDQSLDEIKLLKFVNKNDPADKYHILRLYDYFYYREHLLIVCELLKANLYEFHKFNRESGGEVYFTMPRLQSITIQCLEALQFVHGLGLIHCDLKPENILVKSYSRCEVKVIDLGSSCFETDHLCSYVQSRSYRAPEVILGLPYDKKIDIWSLGCILAELCTGNVLFQNDSPATLLARVLGIIGPIDQEMLAKGRDTYKYFTKNHMLYEKNQETNRLEYLIPKKTSLRHRLPMGDQGFIDFVAHLLEINPKKRPSASEALKHPWLSYPYEPISS